MFLSEFKPDGRPVAYDTFSEDVVHLQAVTFLETVGVCTLLECADAARSASTRPTLHSP